MTTEERRSHVRRRLVLSTRWACACAVILCSAGIDAWRAAGAQQPGMQGSSPARPADIHKPSPPPIAKPAQTTSQSEVFRSRADLVTSDVIARDAKGQFLANLKKDDFQVFEDGVKQNVISFTLSHGGRIVVDTPPALSPEGIVLPPRHATIEAGRIFLIFVDDLHLDFQNTPRIKRLLAQISTELVHQGDMFGMVSTGPSSLSIDLTYDRKRLDEAIEKISGAGLKPRDILETPQGEQGNSEIRYRAHVAFSTAYDIMKKLEEVHDRRKTFIYVSSGYDFNPFEKSYLKAQQSRSGAPQGSSGDPDNDPAYNPFGRQGTEFAQADLVAELSELTREANRANTTIYTLDPRGLVGGMPDIGDDKVDMTEWAEYLRTSKDSLRVLAEQTGGFAVVDKNRPEEALRRIDAETSDYYVLGYYSSNPDPTRKRRTIEIRVTRPGVELRYRTSYTLKPLPVKK